MTDDLNPRQLDLIRQVKAGKVTDSSPDTQDQLLALARLGHLTAEYKAGEYSFTVPGAAKPRSRRARKRAS